MKLEVFFSWDASSAWHRLIALGSMGRKAHCGLAFTALPAEMEDVARVVRCVGFAEYLKDLAPDADGLTRFALESVWKKDAMTGKSGVRGPIPWSKLEAWALAAPSHRSVERVLAPFLDENTAWTALMEGCQESRTVRYAAPQLAANLAVARFGCGFRLGWRNRGSATCVEFAASKLSHRCKVEVLGAGWLLFEELVPSSRRKLRRTGYGLGLYEALTAYWREMGVRFGAYGRE